MGKTPGPVSKVCRPKFIKFCDNVGDPSYFPMPLPDCLGLCRVSFRRHSPLSIEVVKNRTNIKVSWPPFFLGTTPTVLRQIVSTIYHSPIGKVWLSSLCWSPSAKPDNDVESRTYMGWVKWRSSLKPFVDQSLCHFGMMYRRPLAVAKTLRHLTDCLCHVSFRKYRPLNLPLSCEVVQ